MSKIDLIKIPKSDIFTPKLDTHFSSRFIYSDDDKARLTNKQDHRGYTPLYVACKNGNLKV